MKKLLTSVLAAALTVTAAVPFVSIAESQGMSSEAELMAEMRKNVQEYMESKGRTKLSSDMTRIIFLPYIFGDTSDTRACYIVHDDNKCDRYYPVNFHPEYRVLNISLNKGVKYQEVSGYLYENFADEIYYADVTQSIWGFNNFVPDDSEIDFYVKMKNDGNMKVVANALIDAGYVESCYAQFGTVSWNEVTYGEAPLSFFQPTSFSGWSSFDESDENYTTVRDVLDFIREGNIDADFGVVISKEFVNEGIEYEDIDYPYITYDWSEYACIPLTVETDYTALSDDFIDNILGFTAVPYEDSLENQSELLVEIYDNVPIIVSEFTSSQNASNYEGMGYAFDVTNTVNGDANCDGEYTIADSTAILQALGNPDKYGLSFQGSYNADIYNVGDGVTPADALEVQKAMASNANLNS